MFDSSTTHEKCTSTSKATHKGTLELDNKNKLHSALHYNLFISLLSFSCNSTAVRRKKTICTIVHVIHHFSQNVVAISVTSQMTSIPYQVFREAVVGVSAGQSPADSAAVVTAGVDLLK